MNTYKSLIVVLIIIALVITGVYFYQKNVPEPINNSSTVLEETKSGTSTLPPKTYENTDYGFTFEHQGDVQKNNTTSADLYLTISQPLLATDLYINYPTGFAGWINYKAPENITVMSIPTTVQYLKSEAPNDYIFLTTFKRDGKTYVITSRTNGSNLETKEATFKELVSSFKVLVMP